MHISSCWALEPGVNVYESISGLSGLYIIFNESPSGTAHFFCQRPDGGRLYTHPTPTSPTRSAHLTLASNRDLHRRAARRRTANALDQCIQALARFRGQPAPPEEPAFTFATIYTSRLFGSAAPWSTCGPFPTSPVTSKDSFFYQATCQPAVI